MAGLSVSAFLLLLWAATAYIDSGNSVVHLAAAVCPLVTLVSLPVLAISAGRRAVVPGVVAVIAAIVPWVAAAGYAAAGPGPNSTADGKTLRVMYLDAGAGAADAASLTEVVRTQTPDVIVITGLDDMLTHRLAVAGLNRLITPRWVSTTPTSHAGFGVWTRQGAADLQLAPGLPAAQGLLTTPVGTLELDVAQLPGSIARPGSNWHATLESLGRLPARTGHRILVGDLDASPWHPAFRALARHGWRDAADVVGRGLRPTWPAWSPLPITATDHVLVAGGVGASSAETAEVVGTANRALLVNLVVP
jgi:endonuclease/exonuclease/phosphatase (EEP) superfamily protein YafD